MMRYAIARLGSTLIMLFVLSLIAFFLVRLAPGDTITAMLGSRYTEADAEALRQELGLDRAVPIQYVSWLGRALTGDFGRSITGTPVVNMIGPALPVTLQLATLSLIIGLAAGLSGGIVAGVARQPAARKAVRNVMTLGVCIPAFWLAFMLILCFSVRLRWLPSGGYTPISIDPYETLLHLLLPSITLGIAVAAVVGSQTADAMQRVTSQPFIRTARSKGLSAHRVTLVHALPVALPAVVTVAAIQAGYLLGGSVVIEQVFGLPGIGRMALHAVQRRDFPLLQATVLLIGTAFILVNLLADLAHLCLDPRLSTRTP